MHREFIQKVYTYLTGNGFTGRLDPVFPGVQGLLSIESPNRFHLGFAKVEDHFLFVEWNEAYPDRLDRLIDIYKQFSVEVNKGFKTPHVWRMTIPNIAIVAVSQGEFPQDVVRVVRSSDLSPWYGGETGQILLVEREKQRVICRKFSRTNRYPAPGSLPLGRAIRVIGEACKSAFKEG